MKELLLIGLTLLLSGCFNPGCIITHRDWDDITRYQNQLILNKISEQEYAFLVTGKLNIIATRPACVGDAGE